MANKISRKVEEEILKETWKKKFFFSESKQSATLCWKGSEGFSTMNQNTHITPFSKLKIPEHKILKSPVRTER